jgi:hypothetical protein
MARREMRRRSAGLPAFFFQWETTRRSSQSSDGVRLQVDFGKDETALIHEWQVVKH